MGEGRPRPHRRTHVLTVVGLVASAVFTALTFYELRYGPGGVGLSPRMDAEALARALRDVDLGAGGLFVVITVLTLPLRAWRWGLVLDPAGSLADRYHATSVGFMAINLLPARVGELTRGLVLASRVHGLGRAQSVGSVVLVRLLDLIALTLLCFPLPLVLVVEESARPIFGTGLFTMAALSLTSLLLIRLARDRGERGGEWMASVFGARAGQLFASFCVGLGPARRRGTLGAAILATVLVMALSAAAYVPVIARLAPEVDPWTAAVLSLAAVSFGLAIPSAPSGIGLYHFALAYGLRGIGADPAGAAAVAIVTHLGSVVAFVGAGAVSLAITGMPVEALWGRRPAAVREH